MGRSKLLARGSWTVPWVVAARPLNRTNQSLLGRTSCHEGLVAHGQLLLSKEVLERHGQVILCCRSGRRCFAAGASHPAHNQRGDEPLAGALLENVEEWSVW